MTEEDFSRIEDALAVRLPDVYRRRLAPLPIPRDGGNTDTQVWDDSGALITLNQRLRAEVEGWPPWLFVIGQPVGDPCGYAIDTRDPECPVWWLEQMQLGPHSGPSLGSFDAWFSRWVTDTSEGPDGSFCFVFFLVWGMLTVIVLVACWVWAVHRTVRGR
jgi:hypothetical protein